MVVEPTEPLPCGRKGCLEAYAGRAAMEAEARRRIAKGKHSNLITIMEKKGRTRMSSGVWRRRWRRTITSRCT